MKKTERNHNRVGGVILHVIKFHINLHTFRQ